MHLELYAWSSPGTCAIPIFKRGGIVRAFAWVDDEDYPKVSEYRYCLAQGGYARRCKYPGKLGMFLHRDVMGLEYGDKRRIDHINRRRLVCTKANLRFATHAENAQNVGSKPGSSSPYRGVTWFKRNSKWGVRVQVRGKKHHLGLFDDVHEAGRAAADFRAKHMPFSEEAA